MTRILHIEASPRGPASSSAFGARIILDGLKRRRPELVVDHLSVWREPLPPFDGAALDAKYARLSGYPHTPDQALVWSEIETMVQRLDAADAIVLYTPMWNFGIPYPLKHYIDLITQPGLRFSFDPADGYRPLLAARPMVVVLSSAGDYATGRSRGRPDLATGYLREAFGFLGLANLDIETVSPTAGPGDAAERAREQAVGRLARAAALMAARV